MSVFTSHFFNSATKHGHGAVIILTAIGTSENLLVLQRKTEGYPYPRMVGRVCLFGGGREPTDRTARDTIVRELREELPDSWSEAIFTTIKPYSRQIMAPESVTFACITCVFHAHIPFSLFTQGKVQEGDLAIIPVQKLKQEQYAWGTAQIVNDYLEDAPTLGTVVGRFGPDNLSGEVERISLLQDLNDDWSSTSSERWQ